LYGLPVEVVGVPEIVKIFPDNDADTPDGIPEELAISVASVEYVIDVIAELTQTLWLSVPTAEVSAVLHCPHTLTPIIHNPTPRTRSRKPLTKRKRPKLFT